MNIAGIGCCLVDYVYTDFRYNHPVFQRLLSKTAGDGGIIPGGLVFSEDLEKFAQTPYAQLLKDLLGDAPPDIANLGGPSVVAMVHASQILHGTGIHTGFYGGLGDDQRGDQVRGFLGKTPLSVTMKTFSGEFSPTTLVLSDPIQQDGKGERTFINTIGAAGSYSPEDIPDELYQSDIVLAGGTALVPRIHDSLGDIQKKAKQNGCITVVGTVYDFRNQKKNPNVPWPLGSEGSYQYTDLLIADAEEALKLTGENSLKQAAERFIEFGVGALMITHGAKEILVWSNGGILSETPLTAMPVSKYIDDMLDAHPEKRKDSTGCGDNFVGGVIASMAMQMKEAPEKKVDLYEACTWGASSGGFACMYHGGTYYEQSPGEKRAAIEPVAEAYRKQTAAYREK